jgi:hypothetical protein
MKLNVFMGYPDKGIACSLNLFKHEQYPYDSTMYLNEGVTFLLGFVKVTQYLYKFQKI